MVMNTQLLKPEFATLIFSFQGSSVMIDNDLALLYGVSTKALKQQVKRNITRFPPDFIFELNLEEKNELVTKCDRLASLKHSSVLPMVFTEQGVAMLSSVLRSENAIQINIEIMRVFARLRSVLKENEDLRKDVLELDGSELWYEDGKSTPKQLTLGKLLKNTQITRIPV